MRRQQDLKRKLGITQLDELKTDLNVTLKTIAESDAYIKTSATLKTAGVKTGEALSVAGQKTGTVLGTAGSRLVLLTFKHCDINRLMDPFERGFRYSGVL